LFSNGTGEDSAMAIARHLSAWDIIIARQEGTPDQDYFPGTPGKDVFDGLGGDDTIAGQGDSDKLKGGDGNDWIDGGDGTDSVFGGNDDDTVYGGNNNDEVDGDAGRDHLFGDANNDTLSGGSGGDYLDGGTGRDVLYGGGGIDEFIFKRGDGRDRIADFHPGKVDQDLDGIDLRDYDFKEFQDVRKLMSDTSHGVVIALNSHDVITVLGLHIDDLHRDDFDL
jgi:Ca2+-binding RTX toxin-like protein